MEVIDDPYRFPPLLTDFESVSPRRRHTLRELQLSRRAHRCDSLGCDGRALCRLGAECGSRHCCRRIQPLGHAPSSDAAAQWRHLGDFHPRSRSGHALQVLRPLTHLGHRQLKADPYGFACEVPPKSASVVADLDSYEWDDEEWMRDAGADELAESSRSPSTKFTSNPGCASPTARAFPIANSPSSW